MKRKIIIYSLLCISLILSGCFSPWSEGEGNLTINFGGGDSQARNTIDANTGEVPDWLVGCDSLDDLLHIVTITGPGQE